MKIRQTKNISLVDFSIVMMNNRAKVRSAKIRLSTLESCGAYKNIPKRYAPFKAPDGRNILCDHSTVAGAYFHILVGRNKKSDVYGRHLQVDAITSIP